MNLNAKRYSLNAFAKGGKGFTMVEMIVVIGIVTIIASIGIVSFRSGGRATDLTREAQTLALNLRRAQNMALAGTLYQGATPGGYGIHLDAASPNSYVLFADLDNNKLFGAGEAVETVTFARNVVITGLAPAASLNIVYSPPEPTTTVYDDTGANLGNTASAILGYSGAALSKTVNINISGQISVQ